MIVLNEVLFYFFIDNVFLLLFSFKCFIYLKLIITFRLMDRTKKSINNTNRRAKNILEVKINNNRVNYLFSK